MSQFNAFEEAVDFSFWREICMKYGERRHFCRGDYFVHTGEVLKHVGWIDTGGFRHSIIDSSGNRKSVGFVFENSGLANYISGMMCKPISTDIIALEDSEVLIVPSYYLRERFMLDPTLHTRFVQALFEQAYEMILNVYRYTPEERYHQLVDRYPRILKLISLGELASYLNISRRQLHRIRESAEK